MRRLPLATTLATLLVVGVLPVVPASAATTICVGVVVDSQGNGTKDYTCTTVPSGASGSDVLAQRATDLGRPQPRYQDGLLCAIDGFPATGCGDAAPDGGYLYWSYWKRSPGAAGWSYANQGPSTSHPSNGAEEGWSWVDGGSESSAKQPPLVDAATVCPQLASASASAAPATTATAATTAAAAPVAPAPGQVEQTMTTLVETEAAAPRPSDSPTTDGTTVSLADSPTPAPTTGAGAPLASPTGTSDPVIERAVVGAPVVKKTSGFPWPTVVGGLLVLALAGTGTVAARRRR